MNGAGATPDATAAVCDTQLAAALFAVDPAGLGGVVLRGSAGPVRDAWLAELRTLLPPGAPVGRLPLNVSDDRLLGGLDLPASLAAGRPVLERGLLAANDGGVVVAAMAERMEESAAGRLAAALDTGEAAVEREGMAARLPARFGLVLLDEGLEPQERPPAALRERLALHLALDERPEGGEGSSAREVDDARGRLATAAPAPDAIVQALCEAAAAFGLDSLRPPLLALRVAHAHAALRGHAIVTEADAAVAVRLVLAPRALTVPARPAEEDEAEPPPPPPPPPPDGDEPDAPDSEDECERDGADADRLVEAARAALPEGLLDRIVRDNLRAARPPRGGGAGAAAKSARRGRPAGSRAGALRAGDRLDLVATLRAAAPWRRLRGGEADGRLPMRADDFRIRRFVQKRESTTIFVVDASGSAAFQRLGEAKGAVELLLAKAYVSRARVALIAFRDTRAEVLLAPTRSLARARRSLADLPGGGGTPLATGLDAALALALAEAAHDRTPLIVVLTDGRANIARDGSPGRPAAERDALASALRVREAGIGAAFVDTSARPQPGGDRVARAMGAVYAPLPYANAGAMSELVESLR